MNEKMIELIEKSQNYHIATVDENGAPQLRVFSSKGIVDGEFCICMGNNKAVYLQIKANPNVALSGWIEGYSWWRATAKAVETTSEETKEKMFKAMPMLANIYEGRESEFAIFALRDLKIEEF